VEKDERWRFEGDQAIMQMMLAHYDTPTRECLHDKEEICAQQMYAWLDKHDMVICPVDWLDGG
jgi:hypothetical protein